MCNSLAHSVAQQGLKHPWDGHHGHHEEGHDDHH